MKFHHTVLTGRRWQHSGIDLVACKLGVLLLMLLSFAAASRPVVDIHHQDYLPPYRPALAIHNSVHLEHRPGHN